MPNINVTITGFYFGIQDVVVDANDSVADAMRKAAAKSVADHAVDPLKPLLIFETTGDFCTRIGAIHFEPPRSRQKDNPEGLDLQPGIYIYEDKSLGQNPVPSWQYYVNDLNGVPKTKRDPSGDRYIVGCEVSDVAGAGGVPAALEFDNRDTIVWRLISIAFGRSGPVPGDDEIKTLIRKGGMEMMKTLRPSKFA
jgi:hypothetical protein